MREPPSDSRIVCRREWDHTEFIRHIPAKWAVNLAAVPAGLFGLVTFFVVLKGIAGTLDAIWILRAVLVGFAALVLTPPLVSLVLCR